MKTEVPESCSSSNGHLRMTSKACTVFPAVWLCLRIPSYVLDTDSDKIVLNLPVRRLIPSNCKKKKIKKLLYNVSTWVDLPYLALCIMQCGNWGEPNSNNYQSLCMYFLSHSHLRSLGVLAWWSLLNLKKLMCYHGALNTLKADSIIRDGLPGKKRSPFVVEWWMWRGVRSQGM